MEVKPIRFFDRSIDIKGMYVVIKSFQIMMMNSKYTSAVVHVVLYKWIATTDMKFYH